MEDERMNNGQENYNPYTYNPYVQKDSVSGENGSIPQADDTMQDHQAEQNAANPYTYGAQPEYESRQNAEPNRRARRAAEKEAKRAAKKAAGRGSGGFGRTLVRTTAIALVFGLVAGGSFLGVNYAGNKLLGTGSTASSSTADSASASGENTASGAVQATSSQQVSTTGTGLATELTDVSAIVDEVTPSIVAITNISTVTYQSMWGQSNSYQSESAGSGIIVSQDDEYLYIATNNHVVSGAEELSVKFSDNNVVAAESQGSYASGDLAVIKVKLSDIPDETRSVIKIATIGDSTAMKVGEPTIAIGNALGYGQSVTTGIVSALGRSVTTQDSTTGTKITNNNLIQTDAAINPGNSGGALLNKEGQVIGINSVKYSDTSVEGIGYAIPMEDALPIINALIENGKYVDTQTAYLGITGADVTEDIANTYRMPQGVYVSSVYEGTGAANSNLQAGDIITQVGDVEITCMDELKAELANYKAGDTVTIVVYRQSNNGYKGYYVDITLSSAEALENQ